MNIKRIITFIFMLVLSVACMLSFAACGGNDTCTEHVDADGDYACDECGTDMTPACTSHKDENADKLCDNCGAEFFPKCQTHVNENGNGRCDVCGKAVKVSVIIKVVDQDDNAIADVTVYLEDEEYELYELTVDANGEGTLELYTGTYSITYEPTTIPEGYLPIPTTKTVEGAGQTLELEVANNIPNGEPSRPFNVNSETENFVIPANTTYYYIIYHAAGRKIDFSGEGYKVLYNGKTYTPNGETFTVVLEETDSNVPTVFSVENTTAQENIIPVSLYSDPGTQGNPFVIDELGDITLSDVVAGKSVFYKWTSGVEGNFNIAASLKPTFMFDTSALNAKQKLVKVSGDEGSIIGVYSVTEENLTYSITITETTITVEDNNPDADKNVSGVYEYTALPDGGVSIKAVGSEPVGFSIESCNKSIVITNSRNSIQVKVGVDNPTASLQVVDGDVLSIVIYNDVEEDITINISVTE